MAAPSATTAGQLVAMVPEADYSSKDSLDISDPNSPSPRRFRVGGTRKRGQLFMRAMIFISVVAGFVSVVVGFKLLKSPDGPPPPVAAPKKTPAAPATAPGEPDDQAPLPSGAATAPAAAPAGAAAESPPPAAA